MMKYLILVSCLFVFLNLSAQDSGVIKPPDTSAGQPRIQARPRPRPQTRHLVPADSLRRDSLPTADSIRFEKRDYLSMMAAAPGPAKGLTLEGNPFFRFTNPVHFEAKPREWHGKEALFYTIIALLIFFALIKNGFGRYVDDLLKSYFRTTVKQRQLKEQLMQSPLPSLLMNIFFVLSIGMFLALLLQYVGLGEDILFWHLYIYCIIGLLGVYTIKYLSLKLLGWIFQVTDATESYIFIVFTTNKVIGMFLIPFLVVLSFSYGMVNEAAMSLCIVMVLGILVYRFFLSYVSLKDKVRVGFLHFVIYLLAFEVAPLLLINKLLFRFLA
jgi:hypothetical protein